MSNPKQHILSQSDVSFFYDSALSKSPKDIINRDEISKLSKKYGIEIEFINDACSQALTPKDKISIYRHDNNRNQSFFQHLRNAFAHLYIEITADGRCRLHDWNPYLDGKKQGYKASLITMNGDVDYKAFQNLIKDFFSRPQKSKKQNHQNHAKNDKESA